MQCVEVGGKELIQSLKNSQLHKVSRIVVNVPVLVM